METTPIQLIIQDHSTEFVYMILSFDGIEKIFTLVRIFNIVVDKQGVSLQMR